MEWYIFTGALLAVPLVAAVVFYVRTSERRPIDRILFALLIPCVTIALGQIVVDAINVSTYDLYSIRRIVPSAALANGLPIYRSSESGPALFPYGPVGHLLLVPAAFFGGPTAVVVTAILIIHALCLTPIAYLVWLQTRGDRRDRIVAAASAVCLFALIVPWIPALLSICKRVHVDGTGLALAVAGLGLLAPSNGEKPSRRRLLASAVLVALAIWTKPTFAIAPLSAVFYLWHTRGLRMAFRYSVLAGLAIGTLGGAFVLAFGFNRLWFSMFHLPRTIRSLKFSAGDFLGHMLSIYVNILPFLLLGGLMLLLAARIATGRPSGTRRFAETGSWLPLLAYAVVSAPFVFFVRTKAGAAVNHNAMVIYPVATAAAIWLSEMACSRDLAKRATVRAILVLLLALSAVATAGLTALGVWGLANAGRSRTQVAYEYLLSTDRSVFFPSRPLATLLATGELHHLDIGMGDPWTDIPRLSRSHFFQYAPESPDMIILSKRADYVESVMSYYPAYTRQVRVPELPGWTVYVRAEKQADSSQSSNTMDPNVGRFAEIEDDIPACAKLVSE